jgi:AcrR family transcriptional regulator
VPKVIENIRDNILIKGKEMLLTGNYSDFNIRSLAKNCDIGLGTLYNYFENKEVLAYYIFKSDWEKTLQLIVELKAEKFSFKEKLRKIYSSLETFISQYLNIFREMSDGGHKECTHDHYLEMQTQLKELIEEEQKSGSIHNNIGADKLSYFIMSSMFTAIKLKHLTFDEMVECIRI